MNLPTNTTADGTAFAANTISASMPITSVVAGGHFPATSVCVVYQLCGRMRDNGSRPLPQGGCKQSDWRDILNTRDGSY